MMFFSELWREHRGFAKIMVAHTIIFVVLLSVISFASKFIELVRLPNSVREWAEMTDAAGYTIVLIGFILSFIAIAGFFNYHQVKTHYDEWNIGGVAVAAG